MKEIHLTKKDFKLEWYSGQGAGGQHRNKHQNCCRITHLESGITCQGTESRSRVENQKSAFTRLAKLLQNYYSSEQTREISNEVIRVYHAERNEVRDKASGRTLPYKEVLSGKGIGEMIEARLLAMVSEDE